jgi:hypothetical protein
MMPNSQVMKRRDGWGFSLQNRRGSSVFEGFSATAVPISKGHQIVEPIAVHSRNVLPRRFARAATIERGVAAQGLAGKPHCRPARYNEPDAADPKPEKLFGPLYASVKGGEEKPPTDRAKRLVRNSPVVRGCHRVC